MSGGTNPGEVIGSGRAEVSDGAAELEAFDVADNPEPDWGKPGPPPANEPLNSHRRRRQPEPQDVDEPDPPIDEPPVGVANRQAR